MTNTLGDLQRIIAEYPKSGRTAQECLHEILSQNPLEEKNHLLLRVLEDVKRYEELRGACEDMLEKDEKENAEQSQTKNGRSEAAVDKLLKEMNITTTDKDKSQVYSNPALIIPEEYRPKRLGINAQENLLGLVREVQKAYGDLDKLWDANGPVIPHIPPSKFADGITNNVIKVARQAFKPTGGSGERDSTRVSASIDTGPLPSQATSSPSIEFARGCLEGRANQHESSLEFEDNSVLSSELYHNWDSGSFQLEPRGTSSPPTESGVKSPALEDYSGSVSPFSKRATSQPNAINKRQLSELELAPDNPKKRAKEDPPDLTGSKRLTDNTLNPLMRMVVRNFARCGTVDPVTLGAFLKKDSTVGSKIPPRDALEKGRKDHLFIPVHHPGIEHWTLLHCDRLEGRLVHYDSLGRANSEIEAQIRSFLAWYCGFDATISRFEFNAQQVVNQRNGVDCGVYTIETCGAIAHGIDPTTHFSKICIPDLRQEYTDALRTGSLDLLPTPDLQSLAERATRKMNELSERQSALTKLEEDISSRYERALADLDDFRTQKKNLEAAKTWLTHNSSNDLKGSLAGSRNFYGIISNHASSKTTATICLMAELDKEMNQQEEIVRSCEAKIKPLGMLNYSHLISIVCIIVNRWAKERKGSEKDRKDKLEAALSRCRMELTRMI